jgi:hypothetical protein
MIYGKSTLAKMEESTDYSWIEAAWDQVIGLRLGLKLKSCLNMKKIYDEMSLSLVLVVIRLMGSVC